MQPTRMLPAGTAWGSALRSPGSWQDVALWVLVGVIVVWSQGACADFTGKVITVHDGDTITVQIGDRRERVRLFGIDAPERGQAYGNVARKALASRVSGRVVRIVDHGRDSYGRLVGGVFLGADDVNAELVQQGLAWVFRRYSQDAAMLGYEVAAKAAGRGLWREAHPVPPWEWRGRQEPAPARVPLTAQQWPWLATWSAFASPELA